MTLTENTIKTKKKKNLIEGNEFTKLNLKFIKKAYLFKEKHLKTKHNDLFLTFDSLIEINIILLKKKFIFMKMASKTTRLQL